MTAVSTQTLRRTASVALATFVLVSAMGITTPAGAHPELEDARKSERRIGSEEWAALTGGAREAEPAEGTVSLGSPTLTWAGQHYPVGAAVFPSVTCSVPSDRVCDLFRLTVDVDPAHWETHHGGVEIVITWPDPANDFDLHVYDRDTGDNVGSSIEVNPSTGVAQEQVFVANAEGPYDVLVNPWDVQDSAYEGSVELQSAEGPDPLAVPTERLSDVPCEDGKAGPFPCDGVDLLGFVPAAEIDSEGISDIWGWTDPETGDEYVMMGKTNGTAFFRVTDPYDPDYLGALPNPGLTHLDWHDIKVYANHAFIVSESDAHGMVVFDLTRLRGVEEAQEWSPDAIYRMNWAAHNIAINEDSGFAYIVGGNAAIVAPDQCLSGLHIVDIRRPTSPTFAGCYAVDGGPGTAARFVGPAAEAVSPVAYVHDAQCVIYDGPDERYTGREICFNASEDQVTIADVTNKRSPKTLGTVTYEDAAYIHQGWLTDDSAFWIANDELDEEHGLVENTRTIVIDVRDLEDPKVHFEHFHETVSPDHNNYVHEGLLYQSNYSSGLRVLDTAAVGHPKNPRLRPIGFFDTFPAGDETFDGTWSNYPFFESGTIAVSGRGEGLFLLRLQTDEPPGKRGGAAANSKPPASTAPGGKAAGSTVSEVGEAEVTGTASEARVDMVAASTTSPGSDPRLPVAVLVLTGGLVVLATWMAIGTRRRA